MSSSARLYYTDAYLTTFTATVVEALTFSERPAVVLDRTAFYPTSGGQPFDRGRLDDVAIGEVVETEDGRVVHLVERPFAPGATVTGRIDWARRFDHMQQHTGQHVLSAAFDHVHEARTESFHLGSDTSTIDLAPLLSADAIAGAENEANRIVWEDRPVAVRFASEAEAASLPLRKEPARGGLLRLVEVEGFDLSACGGTHVARTGGIGLIAVTGVERFKGGTRVEFVCGGRALARLRAQREVLAACVRTLSVLPAELPAAIERLQGDIKEQRQASRAMQQRLVGFEAEVLARGAEPVNGRRLVVQRLEGWDAQGLKALASAIAERPGHAALLLSADMPALVVVARAVDVPIDAAAVLRQLVSRFGGKGGGRPELAQGGGLTAPPEQVLSEGRAALGE